MGNLWLALILLISSPVRADTDLTTDNGLTYSEWLPQGFAGHHHDVPLLLFSHGFGGCAGQSRTLMQALADHGYAVLAPNHKDAGCEHGKAGLLGRLVKGRTKPPERFGRPEIWTDQTARDRRDDVEALLNFALSHEPYKSAVDVTHIGVMGHSLGGYTALGLTGAWSSWRDSRFKVVLALSPYAAPFVSSKTMSHVAVPVMYQTGTLDIGIGPTLLKQGGYAMTGTPKYLVEFKGAGHFAWTELNPRFQRDIAAYSVAFFDHELMGRPVRLLQAKPLDDVFLYEHLP